MNNILEELERFAEEDPHDPFNLYALALAYLKQDVHRAEQLFVQLTDQHSGYVPTYYQLGQLYASQGKVEEALSAFERGVAAARAVGDQKALREMEAARLAVLYDN